MSNLRSQMRQLRATLGDTRMSGGALKKLKCKPMALRHHAASSTNVFRGGDFLLHTARCFDSSHVFMSKTFLLFLDICCYNQDIDMSFCPYIYILQASSVYPLEIDCLLLLWSVLLQRHLIVHRPLATTACCSSASATGPATSSRAHPEG